MPHVEIEQLRTPGPGGESLFYGLLVSGGLQLPRALQATVILDDEPLQYTVVLLLDTDLKRYKVASLELATDDGVSAAQVRETALPRLLHVIAESDPFAVNIATLTAEREELIERSTAAGLNAWRERAASEQGRPGPSSEILQWVARVYVWFDAVGGRPAKGVQDALGIPSRTASRWIAAARSQSLIEQVDDGQAPDSA